MDGPNVETWFEDHFDGAAREIVDFFAGDGISLKGLRIADIGCGDGLISSGLLHHAEAAEVVGFDILPFDDEELLGFMRAHKPDWRWPPGLRFIQSEPRLIPAPDESFDVAVSWSAFEHMSDPVTMVSEIRRTLRPGGILMLQLWPFFSSEWGGHLWDRPSWDHLRGGELRSDIGLNRITLDGVHRALLAGGLVPAKVEILSEPFHPPAGLMHLPLSELAIGGVKLLAVPRAPAV